MRNYHLDDFPFDDPEIAHALARALAALLWNTGSHADGASTSSPEEVHHEQHITEAPSEIQKEQNEESP